MNSSTTVPHSFNLGDGLVSLLNGLMTNDSGTPDTDTLVGSTTAFWFKVLVYALLSGCVSIIGMMANIVNIIVFVRQGVFTDTGSASLLGLAVSDLCCVTSMLWLSTSFSIVLADPPNLAWEPWDVKYLTGAWPHLMFAQITRMVTAYVTFERCICVVFPFKVKSIFTPKRSITIIASIFVCFGISYSPVFITQQLKHRTDPITNTTRLVLVSSPVWRAAVDIMYYINSIAFNVGSVGIVLVCTMITVSRVNLSKTWRESMTTGTSSKPKLAQSPNIHNSDPLPSTPQDAESNLEDKSRTNQMSKSKMNKEKKLVRMISLISIIFLICYIPDLTFLAMFSMNPEIRIMGKYDNLAMVMYSFTFLMETINSSINILVYYTMSSRFKQECKLLFGLKAA